VTTGAEDSFEALALREDFEGLPSGSDREPADTWSAALVGPLEVHVTFRPATRPTDAFCARLVWGRYPDQAPSVVFIDPVTGRSDVPQAWPTGGPFRPVIGLCVNYTREGFGLHPEWVADPTARWIVDGNVLLKVIRQMQRSFDHEYGGRQQ
jgi:hypothetical protein